MIEVAIFIATATGYAFGIHYDTDIQWYVDVHHVRGLRAKAQYVLHRRGPLAVQAIPLVLLIPVTYLLPETPRWLIRKEKDDKAMKVLRRLHLSVGGEELVLKEFHEIKCHLAAESVAFKPTWKEILTKPSWRRRVLLAAALQSFSQTTGVNCVQYYAGKLLFILSI